MGVFIGENMRPYVALLFCISSYPPTTCPLIIIIGKFARAVLSSTTPNHISCHLFFFLQKLLYHVLRIRPRLVQQLSSCFGAEPFRRSWVSLPQNGSGSLLSAEALVLIVAYGFARSNDGRSRIQTCAGATPNRPYKYDIYSSCFTPFISK
jgi:hypothetical protein